MTIYSLDVLLFLFGTSLLLHVQSNCCFLTCIQISQEADKVVWYSHLSEFSTVYCDPYSQRLWHSQKGRSRCFSGTLLLFLCPMDVRNLISGSSAFSKSHFNIWKFTVQVLLKPDLENFEDYFASVWDECNCVVVWAFFSIAFLTTLSVNYILFLWLWLLKCHFLHCFEV